MTKFRKPTKILWSALVGVYWTVLFTLIVFSLVGFLETRMGRWSLMDRSFEWSWGVLALGALIGMGFIFDAGRQTARVIRHHR